MKICHPSLGVKLAADQCIFVIIKGFIDLSILEVVVNCSTKRGVLLVGISTTNIFSFIIEEIYIESFAACLVKLETLIGFVD